MQGDVVVVRTFKDRPAIRRVWDVVGKTVLITTEENYEAMLRGENLSHVVGFPIQDIFSTKKAHDGEKWDWETAEPWQHSN